MSTPLLAGAVPRRRHVDKQDAAVVAQMSCVPITVIVVIVVKEDTMMSYLVSAGREEARCNLKSRLGNLGLKARPARRLKMVIAVIAALCRCSRTRTRTRPRFDDNR